MTLHLVEDNFQVPAQAPVLHGPRFVANKLCSLQKKIPVFPANLLILSDAPNIVVLSATFE